MERLPQKLVNVRVRDVAELEGAAAVWAAVDAGDQPPRRQRPRPRALRRARSRSSG